MLRIKSFRNDSHPWATKVPNQQVYDPNDPMTLLIHLQHQLLLH